MAVLHGFPAAGSRNPHVLILGSFPSVLSLESGQYYGNPRNHFWPLLAACLGPVGAGGQAPPCPDAYSERLALLEGAGLALWDVIASCERQGSLDENIGEEKANPILSFLEGLPGIEAIGLNGGKAATSFRSHFCPGLSDLAIGRPAEWRPKALDGRVLVLERLPSTSPIPTRDYRGLEDKEPIWKVFLGLHAPR